MTVAATEQLVWYGAYGSNLAKDRFTVYLTGGPVPASPTGKVQDGARDPSPPRDWRRVELPGQLYFAEHSLQWNGGVAFLDPDAPGSALGRAWLVTSEQLADVYRQENGRELGRDDAIDEAVSTIATGRPIGDHSAALGSGRGWYQRLVHCGTIDGLAVVTFTSPHRRRPNRIPGPAYRSTLAAGLIEAWNLGPSRIESYLERASSGSTGTR